MIEEAVKASWNVAVCEEEPEFPEPHFQKCEKKKILYFTFFIVALNRTESWFQKGWEWLF